MDQIFPGQKLIWLYEGVENGTKHRTVWVVRKTSQRVVIEYYPKNDDKTVLTMVQTYVSPENLMPYKESK